MRDSDPRPMPAEVLRAYRDPIDLFSLLKSTAYSDKDRMDVRDDLLRFMLARHGDAWVASGRRDVRVSTRVKSFRANPLGGIDVLLGVPDYGEREETLPMLAEAMQPRWYAWWDGRRWADSEDINVWRTVSRHVLGSRQFAWIASQCARDAIRASRIEDPSSCIMAIESAEAWARVPSEANRVNAYRQWAAMDEAARRLDADYNEDAWNTDPYGDAASTVYAAASAAGEAAVASDGSTDAYYAYSAIDMAARASSSSEPLSAGCRRLCELTKRLITPTLVTSAARSSGAGAVRLAKRM